MEIAIINANLAADGKPAYLAGELAAMLAAAGHEAPLYHAADLALPACDGSSCYRDERTIGLTAALAEAEAIALVAPIYNYDLNAGAKNLIELTGGSWKGKAVGLVVTAGADRSYLSPLSFMNSLALDYRCLVSPRYVYATREDFSPEGVLPEGSPIGARLRHLAAELPVLAEAATRIAAIAES